MPHFLLLTAYHVVQDASSVRVRVERGDETIIFSARLYVCQPDLDVAWVVVDGPLPSDVAPLPIGDSDSLKPLQPVEARGYALGHPYLQYTQGVVSGRTDDKIQVDVAINGGNSGGPLLCSSTRSVVGVVVASSKNAQNVNFVCPLKEGLSALLRAQPPARHVTFPNLNASFSCSPRPLLDKLVSPGTDGVVCRFVHPQSALWRAGLREGDVLTKIAGHAVRANRTVRTSFWPGPLPMEALLARRGVGDQLEMEVARVGTLRTLQVVLEPSLSAFRKVFPEFEGVHTCHFGGLTIQPLRLNHVSSLGGPEKPAFADLPHVSSMLRSDDDVAKGALVITHIAATSPFVRTEWLRAGQMISSISHITETATAWMSLKRDDDWDRFSTLCAMCAKIRRTAHDDDVVTIQTQEGAIEAATWKEISHAEKISGNV